jgi:hypothetical protein
MSQWDFGYGREPTEHHEPQYPRQAPYPYPEQQGPESPYEQESPYAYPPEPQYQYPQAPPGPQHPSAQPAPDPYGQDPDYPYPYAPQPGEPGAPAYSPDQAGWPDNGDQTGWPDNGGWPGGDGYPGGGEPYDPPDPYPITYERDGFEGRASLPAAPPPELTPPYSPWPDAAEPGGGFGGAPPADQWRPPPPVGDLGAADRTRVLYPGRQAGYPDDGVSYRRTGPPGGRPAPGGAAWRQGGPWPEGGEGEWDDEPAGRGRWLIPAALAVAGAAVGAVIVMFALGHAHAAAGTAAPTTGASPAVGAAGAAGAAGAESAGAGADPTPLTLAAARSVLSAYTTANNSANARRSTTTLATVETGGSYAIDAGLYTVQAADGAAPYAAFAPVAATYYIPRAEAAGATRWFVVQVSNAFAADPAKVTSTEYLLFTQAASGGAWRNAVEPYLLAGADAPQVAVAGDGLATAVSATATSLALAPGQLAERTAGAIDGTGAGVTVADPGALADRSDQAFWRGKLPTATVTDQHAAATGAAGQAFALLTTNGGALVFYTDDAELAITPPAGSVIHLTVPGLYSPAQALSRAGLSYLDQFAADDPPAGAGAPRVVADYSGITGKN